MPVGMKPLVLTSVEVGLSDLNCHQIVSHPSYIPTWILWVKQKIVGNKGRPPTSNVCCIPEDEKRSPRTKQQVGLNFW